MGLSSAESRGRPSGIRARLRPIRSSLARAFANDGIRRIGIGWTLGTGADAALLVITLVTVYNLGGVVAAGVFSAVRMVPAVAVGMMTGALLERFRGDRLLVVTTLVRATSAFLIYLTIVRAGTTQADHFVTMLGLFVFGTLAATAGAPVRPTQVTLMPAVARSPEELVAANTVSITGEGVGAFVGPFIAGLLMALRLSAGVALVAGLVFLVTAAIIARLRFEQAEDVARGGDRTGDGRSGGRFRIGDGVRAVRAKAVLGWSLVGVFWQVVTRGLLNAMTVVASIQLLGMGQPGVGILSAALGLGGLVGALSAMSATRSDRLVRTMVISLVFWGLPLSVIGLIPWVVVALVSMVVIGVANATYDVALFTTFQRATSNDERAPVMSVMETVIGLGAVAGGLLAPVLLFVFGDSGGLIVAGLILPVVAGIIYLRIGHTTQISVVDERLVGLIRQVPSFAELPMTACERVASGLEPFAAPAGAALMTQGEPGDRFLVIDTGEVEVQVDGAPIHRLGHGAGVGEIALLRRSARTATVVALTDITGYGIEASTFLAAVAGPAAMAVTERMAEANLNRAAAQA